MRAHGLMFHHFHSPDHPAGQGAISADEFADLLDAAEPCRILGAQEFLERAEAKRLRPTDVCLTFDDNLLCQYEVALPVLEDRGLTAFWFVYSSVLRGNIERLEIYRHFRTTMFDTVDDFYAAFFVAVFETQSAHVEQALARFEPRKYLAHFPFYTNADRRFRYTRDELLGPDKYSAVMDRLIADARLDVCKMSAKLWMNDRQVKQLHDAGHVVGLHSHTHPTRLSRLTPDEQRYEYRENSNHLAALLGQRPRAMSHPCNSYDDVTLSILREAGVTLGFRANMAGGFRSPLEIPREDHANLMAKLAA